MTTTEGDEHDEENDACVRVVRGRLEVRARRTRGGDDARCAGGRGGADLHPRRATG